MTVNTHDVIEIIATYGPSFGPWVIGLITIGVFGWLFAWSIKLIVRYLKHVVEMSEEMRTALKKEKDACEEECRRCRERVAQLVEDGSKAREIFLNDAREQELAHRKAMHDLRNMRLTVEHLTAELETAQIKIHALTNGGSK